MKKIYLLILLLVPVLLQVRADSIPNPSFEQWYFSQWFEIPAGWVTNNSQILPPTVLRDTNPNSGFLAMRLANGNGIVPHAYTGFPVTMHHTNISLFANPLLLVGDSAYVKIVLFDQGQPVDSGAQPIYTGIIGGYFQVFVAISQTNSSADSCMLEIYGGTLQNSDILIDDVSFDVNLGIENQNVKSLNTFPNPCTGFVKIQSTDQRSPSTLYVFSSSGKRIELCLISDDNGLGMYDTSSLTSGTWLFSIPGNKYNYSGKILKQ